MLRTTEMITYCNGFLLNGQPADRQKIEDIFEGRRVAALSVWEQYEQQKQKLMLKKLTPEQYKKCLPRYCTRIGGVA